MGSDFLDYKRPAIKRFLVSGCSGFHAAVTREGDVGAGDQIAAMARSERRFDL